MAEHSNRPTPPGDWPEGTVPTPEQWAAWFVALPAADQHGVAARVLDNGRVAVDCLLRHSGTDPATWAMNRAVLQHEAETPMREHTGTCCAEAKVRGAHQYFTEAIEAAVEPYLYPAGPDGSGGRR